MSVIALFGAIKNQLSPKGSKGSRIITPAFHLHRIMGIVLLGFSILTTSRQFFGDPIKCKPSYFNGPMFEAFCFMSGTFTVYRENSSTPMDTHLDAHRGVSAEKGIGREVRHIYYQWVPFILFFQAVSFYLPYRTWKHLEGEKLSKLVDKVSSDPIADSPINDQVKGVANFLARYPEWYNSNARTKFLCEVANFLNSILQMYFLDLILGKQFFGLGADVISMRYPLRYYHALEDVFPLVTNCEMNYVAPSGNVAFDSGLCILPLNIVNQKIFITIWFLLIILIILSGINLIFELGVVISPKFRYFLLRSRTSPTHHQQLQSLSIRNSYGYYILLTLIARNVDCVQFEQMIQLVAERINSRHGTNSFDTYPVLNIHAHNKPNGTCQTKQDSDGELRLRNKFPDSPPEYQNYGKRSAKVCGDSALAYFT